MTCVHCCGRARTEDRLAKDDVKKQGCLLDGFPRAPDQAQAMVDAGLKVERMLLIEAAPPTPADACVRAT